MKEFARATSRLLLMLAIVAVPAAIYLLVVVKQQADSYTALNLRLVREAGAHLDDRLQVLATIAKSQSPEALSAAMPGASARGQADAARCPDAQKVCVRSGDGVNRLLWLEQLHTSERFRRLVVRKADCSETTAPIRVTIDRADEVRVVVTRCLDSASAALAVTVPLGDLVEPLPPTSDLYAMIVADCYGRVLNATSSREVAITDVAALVAVSPDPKAAPGAAGSDSKTRQSGPCTGPGQSWVSPAVDIAGVPTRVYGHPYRPAGVSEPEGRSGAASTDESSSNAKSGSANPAIAPTWYLIGLQSQSDFSRHTRVLPFELMIVIMPLIVFAVLAWPFLLIWLSGPGASFGRGAPLWFAIAAVFGLGVVTIIVCGLKGHYDVVTWRDNLLARVAEAVDDRLMHELGYSLSLFDNTPAGARMFLGQDGVARAIRECHDRAKARSRPTGQEGCLLQATNAGGTDLLREYANFEFAFEADQQGAHISPNLSLRSSYSSGIAVQDRGYFQRAARGLLWQIPESDTHSASPASDTSNPSSATSFAIEQIRSKDFGWVLSSIAVPATTPARYDTGGPAAVTVIFKRLQSTFQPILPVGVSFAIVRDRQGSVSLDGSAWNLGDVLIHSDDSRSLSENILTETDGDQALRLALEERHSQPLSVNYRGEPYGFYVQPLRSLPWSVVVMYEKNVLRVFTWRNIVVATAAFLFYFLVMGVLVGAVELGRGRLPAFLGPSDKSDGLHLNGALALFIVCLVLCFGSSAWTGPAASPASLWLVLLGSAISLYGLLTLHFGRYHAALDQRKGRREHAELDPKNRRRVPIVATTLCLVGFGLLAANLFFPGAADSRWLFVASSWLILLVFAALFLVPTERLQVPHRSDFGYVAFLICLVAAISVVPAYMLTTDAFGFHKEAYEKFNVEHVALEGVKRETALQDELRRLQPDTFDRPAGSTVEVPPDVWSKAYFGLGATPLFTQCLEQGQTKRAPCTSWQESDDAAFEDPPKMRTATSLFALAAPTGNAHARVFYDMSHWSKDDGSMSWKAHKGAGRHTLADLTLVAGHREFVYDSDDRGLFDPRPRHVNGENTDVVMIGVLFLGCAIAVALTWWALLTVTRTFFGSFALRAKTPPPGAAGSWTLASNQEKQVLRYVANGRLVNCTRNSRTIESLWMKGMIVADPCIRIADEQTKQQARDSALSASELKFESNQDKGAWLAVRTPFFVVLGLAAVVVVVATPQAVPSLFTILAGAAGGVGVIIQVANFLMSRKA